MLTNHYSYTDCLTKSEKSTWTVGDCFGDGILRRSQSAREYRSVSCSSIAEFPSMWCLGAPHLFLNRGALR